MSLSLQAFSVIISNDFSLAGIQHNNQDLILQECNAINSIEFSLAGKQHNGL